MFNSAILEVAIGMAFLYILLSLFCSSIKELISQILSMRANNLQEGIKSLLNSDEASTLAEEVYKHPLIKNLAKEGKKPSYIPSKSFVLALLDITSNSNGKISNSPTKLIESLSTGPLKNTDTLKSISLLINDAGSDFSKAKENLEEWYDNSMDRVAGWYKKKSQNIILGIALIIALFMNIDSVHITRELWKDTTLRSALVAAAENVKPEELAPKPLKNVSEAMVETNTLYDRIDALELPIGWSNTNLSELDRNGVILKILGLLITAFAASLGAPFWFDLLGKMMNIRASGNKPKTSKERKADT